jgi:hypothetical protein
MRSVEHIKLDKKRSLYPIYMCDFRKYYDIVPLNGIQALM